MTERFAGKYFDGVSGHAHAVELRRVGTAHFALEGEGIRRGGTLARLSVTPRLARVARTVDFGDGSRVMLAHDADIDAWFPRQGRLEAIVDRLERHAHAVAVAVFVCATALVAGAVWGVPWAADRIAEKVPADVERALGDEVLANLDRFGLKASVLLVERRDELDARFRNLTADAGGTYRLEFRFAPAIGANAFAVPGGTIVVTDQLVRKLDDDREFDAVVAHEIGHQRNRHALRQTLRSSFVGIIAAFFAGDVSSASAVVIGVPTFLLTSHYSRNFEAEADRFAFDLLARHEESPHWFAVAMAKLERQHPDNRQIAYLSSHPDSGDRIAAAETAARGFAVTHPQLCPQGVCPGDEVTATSTSECENCKDDKGTDSSDLACEKPADN